MSVDLITVLILSLVFGVLFFIADFYEQKHLKLHVSLIAGISVAYFFIIVLPEIAEKLPKYPFHLKFLEYLFVLAGFCFIHITEKLILQKVESRSQKRMRKLLEKEKILKAVEKNMEKILTKELKKNDLDEYALREIAQTLSTLNQQEEDMIREIEKYKIKIQNRINEDLSKFRYFTDYIYHFLVGIILVGLLLIDILDGILFFIFAWFRTIITNRSEAHIIFTDLDIYEKPEIDTKSIKKYLLATSAISGIIIGLIIKIFIELNTELLFIAFSFISGIILYIIVREVMPEKEKGEPLKFLIGMIGFIIIIVIINIFISIL
jgi:zinc transporter ZupT